MHACARVVPSLLAFAVLCSSSLKSQTVFRREVPRTGSRIAVGLNVQVSLAHGTRTHTEVVMAADPADPRRLVACSMISASRDPLVVSHAAHTIAYVSQDGGRTWRIGVEDSALWQDRGQPRLEYSSWDPTCTYGADGVLYFGAETRVGRNRVDAKTRAHVYRSNDGGRSWTPPVPVEAGSYDRPWLVADARPTSPYKGRVYLMFNSKAQRASHNELTMVSSVGPDLIFRDTVDVPNVQVDSASVKTDDERRGAAANPMGGAVLSDGTLVFLADRHAVYDNMVLVSRDGGRTLTAHLVRPFAARYAAYIPWSPGRSLTVDATDGLFRDRLYVAWIERQRERSVVVVSGSSDQGRTWSEPSVVSAAQLGSQVRRGEHYLPALAVNANGVVGISWQERRTSTAAPLYDVWFSASLDGGGSWLPRVRVSEQPTRLTDDLMASTRPIPFYGSLTSSETGQRAATSQEVPRSISGSLRPALWPEMGGHHAGHAATADGVFHPLWVDNRTGLPQVWTAAVRVDGKAIRRDDVALAGWTDVTDRVSLHFERVLFQRTSASSATLSGFAYLANQSADTMRGPFVANFRKLAWVYGSVSLQNARPHSNVLDMTAALGASSQVLAPGTRSGAIPIRFVLTDLRPMGNINEGELTLEARVLAKPSRDRLP